MGLYGRRILRKKAKLFFDKLNEDLRVEIQRQHTGAHMGAGHRLVGHQQDGTPMARLPQLGLQPQGLAGAVPVGDANQVVQVDGPLLIDAHQPLDGPQLAPGLVEQDDLALLVAPEDGLDLQQGAHQRRRTGDAAALAQILQVVHSEILAVILAVHEGGGLQGRDSRPQRRAHAVDGADPAAGIFLHQLVPGQLGRPPAAADAGGNAEIHHVVPLGHIGLEGFFCIVRVHHGGAHVGAGAQGLIILVAVQPLRGRLIVNGQRHGKQMDVVLLPQLGGQVGPGVHKDLDHDKTVPFKIFAQDAYIFFFTQSARVSNSCS